MAAPNEPLKSCLQALTPEQRDQFATACETTLGHLRNVAGGSKSCSPALARLIQHASGGAVAPWHCRPDDWLCIWPELKDAEGAPRVEQAVEPVKAEVSDAA